jgi:hypothetical protein
MRRRRRAWVVCCRRGSGTTTPTVYPPLFLTTSNRGAFCPRHPAHVPFQACYFRMIERRWLGCNVEIASMAIYMPAACCKAPGLCRRPGKRRGQSAVILPWPDLGNETHFPMRRLAKKRRRALAVEKNSRLQISCRGIMPCCPCFQTCCRYVINH